MERRDIIAGRLAHRCKLFGLWHGASCEAQSPAGDSVKLDSRRRPKAGCLKAKVEAAHTSK